MGIGNPIGTALAGAWTADSNMKQEEMEHGSRKRVFQAFEGQNIEKKPGFNRDGALLWTVVKS